LRLSLPKIYPLTDPVLSGLTHAVQVAALIEGGARFIQIREKNALSDEFYNSVIEGMKAAEATGTKIIVNDRVDIAVAAGAHGVHLGQMDLPPAEARKLLGEDALIGVSTHSIEQVRQALDMPVDYIAFGPIWPTSTKEGPDPVVGLALLSEVKRIAGALPVVAIGGINASNLKATLSTGADSAAVISDLYRGRDPISARYRTLAAIAAV
jgi:thiamine-phosphate pyrophosphorylase